MLGSSRLKDGDQTHHCITKRGERIQSAGIQIRS